MGGAVKLCLFIGLIQCRKEGRQGLCGIGALGGIEINAVGEHLTAAVQRKAVVALEWIIAGGYVLFHQRPDLLQHCGIVDGKVVFVTVGPGGHRDGGRGGLRASGQQPGQGVRILLSHHQQQAQCDGGKQAKRQIKPFPFHGKHSFLISLYHGEKPMQEQTLKIKKTSELLAFSGGI